jgi:integrase
MKERKKQITVLSKDELELIANRANSFRDKLFILLLSESGCRISSLIGIRKDNIAFDLYPRNTHFYFSKTGC